MGPSTDFEHLADEHRFLLAHLGKIQRSCTERLARQAAELERLQRENMLLRAEIILRDTARALAANEPGEQETPARAPKRTSPAPRRMGLLIGQVQALVRGRAAARDQNDSRRAAFALTEAVPAYLWEKSVLCVGQHPDGAGFARRMVEMAGGQFMHHATEDTDGDAALEASLKAADLVICQTGCVSHHAYWRVQDYCRRTGKQCLLTEHVGAAVAPVMKAHPAEMRGSW